MFLPVPVRSGKNHLARRVLAVSQAEFNAYARGFSRFRDGVHLYRQPPPSKFRVD